MSAPIKRYDALGDIDGGYLKASSDGRVVLHSDHIASHAFDEAKELEQFNIWFMREFIKYSPQAAITFAGFKGLYLEGWLACSKNRDDRYGK